jgi:hypothetical protein
MKTKNQKEINQRKKGETMNNRLKTVGKLALPILLVAMFSQISVAAEDRDGDNKLEGSVSARETDGDKKLEGSWNHAGTRIDCVTGQPTGTFVSMFTFSRGGTFWEAGTQMSPSLRSPSHGVWSHDSGRLYTTAFQFFRFNADGTLAGRLIVRQEIEVSHDGESYTATSTSQVLDINGNVIATNCATGIGTRFQ